MVRDSSLIFVWVNNSKYIKRMHFPRFYSETIDNQRIWIEFSGGRFTLTPVDCDLLVVPSCRADIEFSSELSRNDLCKKWRKFSAWRIFCGSFNGTVFTKYRWANFVAKGTGLRVASVVVGRKSKRNILKKINKQIDMYNIHDEWHYHRPTDAFSCSCW